jgi:FtsH-binding integral membrane protein
MKVEFDLNFMGVVYLLIAVGLVVAIVFALGASIPSLRQFRDPLNIFINILILASGVVAIGLLVPVVRRLFKAFSLKA